MAWQLIYTSAPRSLEAGRSGFGTVARHRAISPLLVSAIERASQFSRLPGTDSGRVIFSHRIVAVAGGRFHVLSAIRDAGADYTGRTNHIAHHLIVDPREIAQLGLDGPSPADVLLAMQWVTSWNETPRFLEASDEVALSAIHPHTNGSAWEQITGSAHQAWLLATGDASRGAYIIQPGSADLRAVYAESLRLIPDRLWQISFTTSLQPSDEPGDFRWIGIEERSPLRAQSESSGRPVLNLALPDTLPLVETVQPAAVVPTNQFARPPAAASFPTTSNTSVPAPQVFPQSSQQLSRKTRETNDPSTETKPAFLVLWKWIVSSAAVLLLIITWFAIAAPYLRNRSAEKIERKEIARLINEAVDSARTSTIDKDYPNLSEISPTDIRRLRNLADSTQKMISAMADADFQKMSEAEEAFTKERREASKFSLQVPTQFDTIQKRLHESTQLHAELEKFQPKPEDYPAFEKLKNAVTAVKVLDADSDKHAQKLQVTLHSLCAEKEASALMSLLGGNIEPNPEGKITWFKNETRNAEERHPAKKEGFRQVTDLLEDWKFVEEHISDKDLTVLKQRLDQRPAWPPWLQEKVKRITHSDTKQIGSDEQHPGGIKSGSIVTGDPHKISAPTVRAPFYFVRSIDAISKVNYPQLKSAKDFYLQEGISSTPKKLLMPPAFAGKLYRKSTEDGEIFSFEPKTGTITPGTDKGKIQSPYSLIARNSENTDIITFCVVPPNDGLTDCLLGPPRDGEIRPPGKKARIDFAALRLPAFQDVRFELRLTKDWALPRKSGEIRVSVNNESGLTDTKSLGDEAVALKGQIEGNMKRFEGEHPVDRKKEFADLKAGFLKISGIEQTIHDQRTASKNKNEPTYTERMLGADTAPLIKQYGGCIEAFTASKGFRVADELIKAGQALKDDKLIENEQVDKLKNVAVVIDRVIKHLRTTGNDNEKQEKEKFEPSLQLLKKMNAGPQSETPQVKEQLKIAESKRSKELKDCETTLKILDAHPVFEKNPFPSGRYRLFAIPEDRMGIPILDIEVK